MKKMFFVILLLLTILPIFAQRKPTMSVVFQAASTDKIDKLKANILKVFLQNKDYVFVDRSEEFEKAASEIAGYQSSGLVKDDDILELGRRLGEEFICLIKVNKTVSPNCDENSIESRIVDIQKSSVVATGVFPTSEDLSIQYKNIENSIAISLAEQMSLIRINKFGANSAAMIKSMFLPGLGQMTKHRGGFGSLFLSGEIALVGFGFLEYYLSQKDLEDIRASINRSNLYSYLDVEEYSLHKEKYNKHRNISNAFYIAAGVLYLWNIVNAYTIKPQYSYYGKWMKQPKKASFSPYVISFYDEPVFGACLNIQF